MSIITIKYIRSVGVELEGGMCASKLKEFKEALQQADAFKDVYGRLQVGADGSVNVGVECGSEDKAYTDLELKTWIEVEKLEQLVGFVKLLWSYGFKQNQTCGNHMHLRFRNTFYVSIFTMYDAVREYLETYRQTFRNRRKYLQRLHNNYSRAIVDEEDIAINLLDDDRYYAINLLSFFKHSARTLEIRIMPYARNADEYIRMLTFNLVTVDRIVDKYKDAFRREFELRPFRPSSPEVFEL
jgi:hypothetical protein